MRRNALLAATVLLTSSFAWADEAISPEDQQKILADVRARLEGTTDIEFPGVDRAKSTVRPVPSDFETRAQWLDAMTSDKHGERAMQIWAGLKRECQLTTLPKVVIDIAVVRLFKISETNSPLEFFAPGYLDMNEARNCGDSAKGKAVRKFMQQVKTVHYVLSKKWPMEGGKYVEPRKGDKQFTLEFKAGELTIGVHSAGFNVYEAWNTFVQNQ